MDTPAARMPSIRLERRPATPLVRIHAAARRAGRVGGGDRAAAAHSYAAVRLSAAASRAAAAGLTRFLQLAGVAVWECERPRRRDRRRGKSDLIDAAIAGRRLLAGEGLSVPRGGEVRARLEPLSGERLARAAARQRSGPEVTAAVLRRLGRRVEHLSEEIGELERALTARVAELAPALLGEPGVGPVCAAQLLVSSGEPKRMASEASFAALAGTSPVEASSGKQQRHRLNRGGDRQLNWALHVIALARIRRHVETAAYYQRLLATGKTRREARRCVKRAVARHFYRQLRELSTLPLTT
jgi:transposase